MKPSSRIYIPGHTGLVGSAIERKLRAEGFTNILSAPSKNLDLRCQICVDRFFNEEKPEYVFLAAGKVGGIFANNSQRAEFIYDNIMMQTNIIHASWTYGVEKLLVLGSSCIYPRNSVQPIVEAALFSGELEPTNEPYAVSKIAALKTCEAYRSQYGCNFISAMPTNLYGMPGDHYDPQNSHVLPALVRKFIVAKKNGEDVTLWGTGTPRREFMHVDDMADASLFLMKNYNETGHINVGTGEDIELNELANIISEVVSFTGNILHDTTKPDGMMKKRLDVSKINSLGWKAKVGLKEGVEQTVQYIYNHKIDETW